MKTTLKQIAAGTFIVLLVLAGNVKAEGTELKTSALVITETSLQIENWMTSEAVWNKNTLSYLDFALETEENMEIESWMASETIWNVEEIIKDENLLLENWMVDSEFWK